MQTARFEVTTLGESLLRLSVPIGRPLELTSRLDMNIAGSESNVLAILAQLDHRCSWVSALPDDALGRLAANQFRLRGIDLSGVVWREKGRLGKYFVEMVAPPRPVQVIYDREHSCMTQLTSAEVDWDLLLDTRLLHLTGITPALSPSCREITISAVAQARAANIPLSFDINLRQKLWSLQEAAEVLLPLVQNAELLFCARRDAEMLFGCEGDPERALAHLAQQTNARHIVMSIGAEGALGWDGSTILHQPPFETTIIDAMGAGDALAGGVIDGWLRNDFAAGLKQGVALAAMALSQVGDMVVANRSMLDDLVGKGQRKVQR